MIASTVRRALEQPDVEREILYYVMN